jgi:hypothetical protein
MCIFIRGFWVSVRVLGIRGFGFDDGFSPELIFGSGSGFDFGFRFWVHGDSTQSEPDPLPSLPATQFLDRFTECEICMYSCTMERSGPTDAKTESCTLKMTWDGQSHAKLIKVIKNSRYGSCMYIYGTCMWRLCMHEYGLKYDDYDQAPHWLLPRDAPTTTSSARVRLEHEASCGAASCR